MHRLLAPFSVLYNLEYHTKPAESRVCDHNYLFKCKLHRLMHAPPTILVDIQGSLCLVTGVEPQNSDLDTVAYTRPFSGRKVYNMLIEFQGKYV